MMGEVTGTSTGAGSGLARIERLIRSFSWSQAKGIRMASPSQALVHLQATKQTKIGSREPEPGLATHQTHPMFSSPSHVLLVP